MKGCGCKDCQAKYPVEHTHKFTVPVEWEYRGVSADWRHAHSQWPMPQQKRVTKLRCESCPEEIERCQTN